MNFSFKKLTAFLLALSFVLGVSGIFPAQVSAQTPPGSPTEKLGTCNWARLESKVSQTRKNVTYSQCQELAKQDGAADAAWFPNDEEGAKNASPPKEGSLFDLLQPTKWVAKAAGSFAAGILLPLAGWLTWLSGAILNFVINWTVVDMKKNLDVDAVNTVWRTVRDLGNMGFIFVLLYAAITTILGIGKDNKTLIVKIVVVAILINFSLFFTKFIIDMSNVLAITLYDAAAHGALAEGVNGGLANSLMEPLGLQTIWNIGFISIDGYTILIAGVMGTVVALIAAFVFLAMAILFVIRFVVLLFVLALSPIAFLSFVLPELKKYRDQWWGALSGQAFFAPIFFLMMWIVIVISRSILLPLQKGNFTDAIKGQAGSAASSVPDPSAVGLFINYAIVIALLITAMVLAKEWANKAGGGINKLTSWATGAAGGATLGMAGRFGRGTFGRAGAAIGDSEKLKEAASQGGIKGMSARLALATSRKTAGASFDLRGTGLSSQLDAGKAQKGGFTQVLKDKREKEKKFAESLGASDVEIAAAEREMEKAKTVHGARSVEFSDARDVVDKLKGIDEKEAIKRYRDGNRNTDGSMISENDAKNIINADRDTYIKKGLKDVRKEHLVEAIEKSPTYKAAAVVQKITDKTPKVLRWTGARALPNLIKAKNRAAIAEIRKDKKPVKDQLEAILREAGDLPAEGTGGGAAPTPPAPAGGGPAPTPTPAP